MPALPYQTFTSTNCVFIGADATIAIKDSGSDWPHRLAIRDRDQRLVVELLLTTDALVALQVRISAVLDNAAEVASWADRQIEVV